MANLNLKLPRVIKRMMVRTQRTTIMARTMKSQETMMKQKLLKRLPLVASQIKKI